jgi:hypothetical protein
VSEKSPNWQFVSVVTDILPPQLTANFAYAPDVRTPLPNYFDEKQSFEVMEMFI